MKLLIDRVRSLHHGIPGDEINKKEVNDDVQTVLMQVAERLIEFSEVKGFVVKNIGMIVTREGIVFTAAIELGEHGLVEVCYMLLDEPSATSLETDLDKTQQVLPIIPLDVDFAHLVK